MKPESSVAQTIGNTIRKHPGISMLLLLTIVLSIGFSLLPPLVLEIIVNTLTEGEQILLSMQWDILGL